MIRVHKAAGQSLLLLLVLFLTAYGGPQPVRAGANYQDGYSSLSIIRSVATPSRVCIREKIDLQFKFRLWAAPLLIPEKLTAVINISATNGTVDFKKHQILNILNGKTYVVNFSYKGTKEGDEKILIKVSIGKYYKNELTFEFPVKQCPVSVQWNHTTTLAYQMVSIVNTYSGTGTLSVNKDGQVSGNGSQAIWSYINPYSDEGGSCTHNAPWDSGSGISFSGQFGDAGEPSVNMELEALSINSTSPTCTGEDSSGTMAFPEYTFDACQILLAGFNFDAGTQDFQFNCPGEAPYTVLITVIPRSEK